MYLYPALMEFYKEDIEEIKQELFQKAKQEATQGAEVMKQELFQKAKQEAAQGAEVMKQELFQKAKQEAMQEAEAMKQELFQKARQEAIREVAEQQTRQETLLTAIRDLMNNLKWSSDQAMAALNIPQADRIKYMGKL